MSFRSESLTSQTSGRDYVVTAPVSCWGKWTLSRKRHAISAAPSSTANLYQYPRSGEDPLGDRWEAMDTDSPATSMIWSQEPAEAAASATSAEYHPRLHSWLKSGTTSSPTARLQLDTPPALRRPKPVPTRVASLMGSSRSSSSQSQTSRRHSPAAAEVLRRWRSAGIASLQNVLLHVQQESAKPPSSPPLPLATDFVLVAYTNNADEDAAAVHEPATPAAAEPPPAPGVSTTSSPGTVISSGGPTFRAPPEIVPADEDEDEGSSAATVTTLQQGAASHPSPLQPSSSMQSRRSSKSLTRSIMTAAADAPCAAVPSRPGPSRSLSGSAWASTAALLATGSLKSLTAKPEQPGGQHRALTEPELPRHCRIPRPCHDGSEPRLSRIPQPHREDVVCREGGFSHADVIMPFSLQPPPVFLCPILHSLMRDPVTAADGQTYERDAIRLVFQAASRKRMAPRSPLNGLPLTSMALAQNQELLSLIQLWRNANPHYME